MSRIVTFADGFTSNTEPLVEGSAQLEYTLLNNQASFVDTGLEFDELVNSSAILDCEIERKDGSNTYRQIINITASFNNGQWFLNLGQWSGYELIKDALSLGPDVVLTIGAVSGKVQYMTSNMSGHVSSKLKVSITRISA